MTLKNTMRLQRFHEAPPSVPPTQYKTFVFSNYTFFIAGVFHFLFIGLFAFLQVPVLALYNILSAGLWGLCVYFNLRGTFAAATILANLELLVHAVLCTIVIGWDTGFHYYILAVPLVSFLSFWPLELKLLLTAFNIVAYVLLSAYAHYHSPTMQLDQSYVNWLNYANGAGIFFAIAWVAYIYRSVVDRVEGRLEKERQRTAEALDERNRVLDRLKMDLADAANYVHSALPAPIISGDIRVSWQFLPSASLGGDVFGYHWLDRSQFAVYLIDVSGHGVGAALLSVTVMNLLKSRVLPITTMIRPSQVLKELNQRFPGEENDEMFFSMWYGVYDRKNRLLTYASGGHPPAVLFRRAARRSGETDRLHTPNFVIGGRTDVRYRQGEQIIARGSDLYIFSDGVYEFNQPDGRIWRYAEFVEALKSMHANNLGLDHLVQHTRKLCQAGQFDDDFTILRVSIH
jgi:sigma-B regulation protein RsbU (phosphoserine phosphatase)